MMRRLNLTILFVLISGLAAAAQKDAVLFDSFGLTPNGDFRARADVFIQELSSNQYRDSRAMIVVYGRPSQIESRKRLIYNHFSNFRKFPASRMEVKVGGNISAFRTEFWLIPAEAAPPELKPEAWIFKDMGRAYRAVVSKAMSDLDKEARKLSDHQSYIINYGTPGQIVQREKWIRDAIVFRRFDSYRITLVNGGNTGTVRTLFWLVPPGAVNPTP